MLNEKQQMVVGFMQEGRSPKYIARKLKTSERVAKTYMTKLTRKGVISNGEEDEPAPVAVPACKPIARAVGQEGPTRLMLGATVEYLLMVGGAERAHKLIDEVRTSLAD